MKLAPWWARFRPLIMFGVAGVIALFVDIGVLYVLRPVLGLYGARLCSFLAAATFTWLFNRSITFQEGAKPDAIVVEYLAYLSSMAVGGAINYLTYALSVKYVDAVRAQPAFGVALGSLVGMGFNFLSARRIMQGKS
ncbi:MAG: GtrA family protein [Aquabacterium sp.]